MKRFLTERQNIRIGSSVKLERSEAEHIRKSLRMSVGDQITLFNGEKEFAARLKLISKEAVMAEIIAETTPELSSEQAEIWLFLALVKLPQFELALQKVTELGVTHIVPITTEYTQVRLHNTERRYERWDRIIKEACKQSERISIPTLHPIQKFEDSIKQKESNLFMLLTLDRQITKQIGQVLYISTLSPKIKQADQVAIFIGPEGGFSLTEHKLAIDQKIPLVSINTNTLKTETAAISAITLIIHLLHK